MAADRKKDEERVRELTRQAIALCDALGYDHAAVHLQMGLDLLDEESTGFRLREMRSPWPESD